MQKSSKKNILTALIILILGGLIFIAIEIYSLNVSKAKKENGVSNEVLSINPYTNDVYISEKEMQEKIENIDVYKDLDIVVHNLYDFVKVYKGDLSTNDYTNYIKQLNIYFYELYSETYNLSIIEEDEYFENNKEELKAKYGIEDEAAFDKLLEYVSIYEDNTLQYKEVSLEKDTVIEGEEYVRTTVNITYSNDLTKTIFISVLKDTNIKKPEFLISF